MIKKHNRVKSLLLVASLFLISGCAFNDLASLSKRNEQIREHSRQNNQAALFLSEASTTNLVRISSKLVDELKTEIENTVIYPINKSKEFLDRNSLLLGLPSENQKNVVAQILSTNSQERAKAEKKQEKILDKESELVQNARVDEKELQTKGAFYEKEQREALWKRIKWISISFGALIGLAGIIALPFLFPAFGGILVSLAPSLSSIFRVVPKSTLENKVKGISEIREYIKQEISKEKELNSEDSIKSQIYQDIYEAFKKKLSENEFGADRAIIDYFRNKLK